MKTAGKLLVLTLAVVATPVLAGTLPCPPDSVKVGPTCVDKYEASVWSIPASNTKLIAKVQAGTATLADLTGGGATLVSPATRLLACDPPFPSSFPATGNWTAPLYAASVAGVQPTACVTWFQADQACALSGKRLIRNDEWQRAAAGTPDGSSDCNISTFEAPVSTGSYPDCKSAWGAFDMVGNVGEWVADWADKAVNCKIWPADFGSDFSCFGGPGTTGNSGESDSSLSFPSALIRGGFWFDDTAAGVFAVTSHIPSVSAEYLGFRCAR